MKKQILLLIILVFCFTSNQIAQNNLKSSLVAYYPFNSNADDESENGNNGIVSIGHAYFGAGTPVLTTDRFGEADKAYYFDAGGNIEVPYSTDLNPATITLSWWIYMEEQDNNDYMISMNRWNCFKVNLQTENKVFFTTKVENPDIPGEYLYNDRDHNSNGLIAETWYHLAVSYGSGHMKFYIDGVLVHDWDGVTDLPILDISGTPINLTLGQDLPTDVYSEDITSPYYVNWGGFFKGKMDDIRIYNQVLSDTEIQELYLEILLADFEADITYGNVPLSVNFNDLSTQIATNWLWDFGDGNTSTLQNPSHTYNTVGSFTVSLTVTHADDSDTETKTDYVSTIEISVNDISVNNIFNIYPNPNNGILNFEFLNNNKEDIKLEISNSKGQIIFKKRYCKKQNKDEIDLSNYPKGIYFIHVSSDTYFKTEKLIIE